MMPNDLPLPDDLQYLIEKRNEEARRRSERRAKQMQQRFENAPERRSAKDPRRTKRRNED